MMANGKELKHVESFCFLGEMFDSSAVKETAVNQRIDQCSKTVGLLFSLLKDNYAPRECKVIIYKTIMRPIFTRGCAAWTL